ncbi:hypothetical protein Scep_024002 [Stephania cephalantha]|uniref:Uncharacterized protein n=1 Tax=Stephania cephalantha TaxID=152367 RepID=A0AAP0HWR5_9MAGN
MGCYITVVTSNKPYSVSDGSNPFFDGRPFPKFNLRKSEVHKGGHVRRGSWIQFVLFRMGKGNAGQTEDSRGGVCTPLAFKALSLEAKHHDTNICYTCNMGLITLKSLLISTIISVILAVGDTKLADGELVNVAKLDMFVDKLSCMPKIYGFEMKNGVHVSKSLEIGMFMKRWHPQGVVGGGAGDGVGPMVVFSGLEVMENQLD